MKAIIEIPKGDSRRRHIKYDKSGFIDLGPIKNVIPVNDGIMPVHYGYIPETLNEKELDEIDILVLSDKRLEVGQEVEVEPIALINREDGDDKIMAVDETKKSIKNWEDVSKNERELVESFFSYHHKFRSIEDAETAKQYIENGHKQFLATRRYVWNATPNELDPEHAHDFDTDLMVFEGEIEIQKEGKNVVLKAGDKMHIPRGVPHSGKAGRSGCKYVVVELL